MTFPASLLAIHVGSQDRNGSRCVGPDFNICVFFYVKKSLDWSAKPRKKSAKKPNTIIFFKKDGTGSSYGHST